MAFKPHGIVVPIVTPVTQDGKFNEKAYRDLIEYLANSGIHGVFPFGTTGEFYAHNMDFYREVLAVTKDAVRGRMDIYAGANNITTRGAVEIAKAVEQVGGIDEHPVAVEITYGLERIAMYIQEKDNVYDLEWTDGVTYGDVWHENEYEQSVYSYELSDHDMLFKLFDMYEKEATRVVKKGFVLPAYDYVLKCSHAFNLLDAAGAISLSERTEYIARVRNMARMCAKEWLKKRKELGFPMLKGGEGNE